jgi:hypothetical protein
MNVLHETLRLFRFDTRNVVYNVVGMLLTMMPLNAIGTDVFELPYRGSRLEGLHPDLGERE